MHREVEDFQRNHNQNNQSIDYNMQKADYKDTCDEGASENNEKDIYLRILSCGNCRFETSSVEKMTKHKESIHAIIWSGKEYVEKVTEYDDLEFDEEGGEEEAITKNRFEKGYQLWDLGHAKKATEDKDLESNEEEGEEDDVTKNRLKNGYKLWDLRTDK